MFKLAELFVSIKAKDEELQKQLGSVKSSLSTAAIAMGTAIGGGAIGIITKLAEVAVDFVKDTVAGSEELQAAWGEVTGTFAGILSTVTGISGGVKEQLQEMFEPAIGAVLEYATNVLGAMQNIATKAKPYIDAFKEGITNAVAKAQPYVNSFLEAVEGGLQNVGIAIQAGVEQWGLIKQTFADVAARAQQAFDSISQAIMRAFGGTAISSVTSWGNAIEEAVVDKLETVAVFIRNWPDVFDIAALQITEVVMNIGARFATIPENAKIVGEYIANNWRQLISDALQAIGVGLQNLGENFGRLGTSINDFFSGKGWHFDFKPMLDGFKATAEKLPELAKPKLISLQDEINEKLTHIAEMEAKPRAPFDFGKKKQDEAAKAVADKQAQHHEAFKSQTLGVADLRSHLVAGAFNRDKEAEPKKQTDLLAKIVKATEKTAEGVKKPQAAVLG